MPCWRRFHQAAAERVIDRNGTVPHRFHEARYPQQGIAAQFQRIAETVIQTAQDHIDRFQATQRLEIHAAIEHSQIRAFDQREAPLPRQERMFEVGFVVRAGRQQNDRRIRALISGERQQGIPLHIVRSAQAGGRDIDRTRRQCSRAHQPVLKRVSHAGRRLRPVGDDPPTSRRGSRNIHGIRVQVHAALEA